MRQSGKNSADIRMVVDALDLCYTKSHVDTFVIVSGDSDFSPLVSKLRENAKTVIGVGVKNSSSDLLINNCDEFIYYDDLVRADEQKRRAAKKRREAAPASASGDKGNGGDKKQEAFDLMLGTLEALIAERDADERIWGSMVKQALKRRNPGFNETYYGFQRVLRPARGSREERPHQARSRREIGRLRGQARLAGSSSQAAAGKGLRDVVGPGLQSAVLRHQPGALFRRYRLSLRTSGQPFLARAACRGLHAASFPSFGERAAAGGSATASPTS